MKIEASPANLKEMSQHIAPRHPFHVADDATIDRNRQLRSYDPVIDVGGNEKTQPHLKREAFRSGIPQCHLPLLLYV